MLENLKPHTEGPPERDPLLDRAVERRLSQLHVFW